MTKSRINEKKLPLRSEVDSKYIWDLSSLFSSWQEWEESFSEIEDSIVSLSSYKGKLSSSSQVLVEFYKNYLKQYRELTKLYTYAHLRSDEDTQDTKNLGLLQRVRNLYARVSAECSFVSPELIEIKDEVIKEFFKDEALLPYKRVLEETRRYKPHTLSPEQEHLLALGQEVFQSSSSIFSQLNNADFDFGHIEHKGKKIGLSHGSYTQLLREGERDLREKAYQKYYSVFNSHKNTISSILTASVQKDIYLGRARRYTSALEASLFSDQISKEVYENLISVISLKLPVLHKYYDYRKDLLKLDKLKIYDTYVPIVDDVDIEISYEEGVDILLESFKPLGDEYVTILEKGLREQGWVDVLENKGKRSGAYSSGCYDSYPYILMSYKPNLDSLYTLAHEIGHSMHSYFSRENQTFQDSSYTIFVAEVASTFNEQLLTDYLVKKYKGDDAKTAYLINHQLDDIKSTMFRQVMFAEFEKIIHEYAEANRALTLDYYREVYAELLGRYFGPAVELNDFDSLECLRIPHFYSAFYVYKYATGLAAAISLSRKVIKGDKSALNKYLDFLKAGCSKPPLDLLKDAGVDLRGNEPVESACNYFSDLLKTLVSLQKTT